jgi:putative salt-induced outer membrane protein YdiY
MTDAFTEIEQSVCWHYQQSEDIRKGSGMHIRFLVLSVALLLTVPLRARDVADVMVMTNGDRMTCKIKGLEAGVLYVDFDYIDGTASVDWSKVARLESNQLFVVKTESGAIYTGRLRTPETVADRPMRIQVLERKKEDVIDRSQIVQMIATSDRFWERFNGEVSLGVIYSKGNQSTQYNLGSQTAYVRERWTALAGFNSNLSSSTGDNASTRNALNLGVRRLLPRNNWFYAGIGAFLQSSEQGIALQSTVGGGLGRYLKNTNRASISVIVGPAWQNTNYKRSGVPVNNQNLAAAILYGDVQLFKFSKTNFDVTAAVLPALSDPGRIRFNTNASYYIKIVSNLKWNLSFYGNWDNRPPPGFSGSDYGTSSGLSWTFGLK